MIMKFRLEEPIYEDKQQVPIELLDIEQTAQIDQTNTIS